MTDTSGVIALQLRMVGSTFRLLPEAKAMAKFLPLDTISLRYVAWEVLVEVLFFFVAVYWVATHCGQPLRAVSPVTMYCC